MSDQQREKVNWIGVSLLVIGIAFLYRKFEWQLFDLPDFLYSWEYILVVIGSILLLTGHRSGIPVLLVGLFFIFTEEFIHFFREFSDYWPVSAYNRRCIYVGTQFSTIAQTQVK